LRQWRIHNHVDPIVKRGTVKNSVGKPEGVSRKFCNVQAEHEHYYGQIQKRIIRTLVVTYDNRFIYSASGDFNLKKYSLKTMKCVKDLGMPHRDFIINMCITHNNRYLFTAGTDGTVRMWRIRNDVALDRWVRPFSFIGGPESFDGQNENLRKMGMTPDGKTVVLGSVAGNLSVIQVRSGKVTHVLTVEGKSVITGIAVAKNSVNCWISTIGGDVVLVDLDKKVSVYTIRPFGPVNIRFFFSEDIKLILT
jgi:WD40 repeat protein